MKALLSDAKNKVVSFLRKTGSDEKNDQNLSSLCAFLLLIVVPTIQHGPQVFSTIEGIPLTLPCRAIGVPAPDISWAKVGFAVSCW